MIENLQDQRYQLENKQVKDAKLCANIKWELVGGAKNAQKPFSKYFNQELDYIKNLA